MRIEIKNEEIINFYEKHPNLDIETINLYFIDIINVVIQHGNQWLL